MTALANYNSISFLILLFLMYMPSFYQKKIAFWKLRSNWR